MKIVVAGASGFIGRALVPALRADGHEVCRLVRTTENAGNACCWDPASRRIEPGLTDDVDVAINLAGENVAAGRWTAARRERIRSSRVNATQTLVDALIRQQRPPRLLINASAVGIYGGRGNEELTEDAMPGDGFLADVCREWEAAARAVEPRGVRVVMLRFGLVLDRDGGALGKILPMFRLGLGGPLGSGAQWMSWIARDDVIGIVRFAIEHPECRGPVNVVAPTPITNREFTIELGRTLGRPAVLPVPAAILRAVFGQMADETLLASTRAIPTRLREWGYRFRHATLPDALPAILR